MIYICWDRDTDSVLIKKQWSHMGAGVNRGGRSSSLTVVHTIQKELIVFLKIVLILFFKETQFEEQSPEQN